MHPPMLYTGYVGFSVAFVRDCRAAPAAPSAVGSSAGDAYSQQEAAALANWVRWARPWTNVAWAFLTFGIALGSWWAYYVLGWGGWWFWDPVENASFMPWLVGTALIHSQAVTESAAASARGLCCCRSSPSRCRCWHVSCALRRADQRARIRIRSETRTVHLAFLGTVVGGSLLLYALRAPKVAAENRSSCCRAKPCC
jgi:cytochrome c-type biogenesis protein CcmF